MNEGADRGCLERAMLERQPAGTERRHDAVMEWAETELGFDRGRAERIHALAEEERLDPVYALQLVHCGVVVVELQRPSPRADQPASQPDLPGWVAPEHTTVDDVVYERRLRLSFRRLRGLLEAHGDAAAAARAYVAEPDVASFPAR